MANKLDAEARMTIKSLAEHDHTNRAIGRLLGYTRTRCAITDVARQPAPLTAVAGRSIWPRRMPRRLRTGWSRLMAVARSTCRRCTTGWFTSTTMRGACKTHLGIALGVKAIEHGFGVVFYRLDELLPVMRRDAELPPSLLRCGFASRLEPKRGIICNEN